MLLVLVLAGCTRDEHVPEPSARAAPASAPDPVPERFALRLGQCGHVEAGALRGGLQPAVLSIAEFGPGISIDLDQLQLRPVAGSWFCLLRTAVGEGEPPRPRRPADLGRFTLLREERRTIDPAGAESTERWVHVTDPAWIEELARHRRSVEEAPASRRAAVCEQVGRARPDPERIRSTAVTAMRHWVATGQLPELPPAGPLEDHVHAITEACGW